MTSFDSPKEIPKEESARELNTTYNTITPLIAAERLQKIEPGMQHALAVCGQVFKDCKYPWAMIGSNALVLEADTEKKGKDLDIIFADQDFDIIKDNFEKLVATGEVSELKVTPMVNFKNEPNGCLKISGLIKTGETSEEFEAFAQNIDPAKTPNGIINIGLDPHGVNIYEVPNLDGDTTQVNFLDKNGVEELYLKNLTNEFGLYQLQRWQDKKFLNAKALQRLANLHNLGNTTEDILDKLSKLKNPSPQITIASDNIKTIWKEFKGLEISGPGLIKTLGSQAGFKDDRYRSEKVTDRVTEQSVTDMENISEYKKLAEASYEVAYQATDKEIIKQTIKQIADYQDRLIDMFGIYSGYQELADKNQEEDFCVYAALPHLIEHFILPVTRQLANYKISLEDKSESINI